MSKKFWHRWQNFPGNKNLRSKIFFVARIFLSGKTFWQQKYFLALAKLSGISGFASDTKIFLSDKSPFLDFSNPFCLRSCWHFHLSVKMPANLEKASNKTSLIE
jgi:hypothetical protein